MNNISDEYLTDNGGCKCELDCKVWNLLPREHIRLPPKLSSSTSAWSNYRPCQSVTRSTQNILPKITLRREVITCYCWCPLPGIQRQQSAGYRPHTSVSLSQFAAFPTFIFFVGNRGIIICFDYFFFYWKPLASVFNCLILLLADYLRVV